MWRGVGHMRHRWLSTWIFQMVNFHFQHILIVFFQNCPTMTTLSILRQTIACTPMRPMWPMRIRPNICGLSSKFYSSHSYRLCELFDIYREGVMENLSKLPHVPSVQMQRRTTCQGIHSIRLISGKFFSNSSWRYANRRKSGAGPMQSGQEIARQIPFCGFPIDYDGLPF